MGQPSERHVHLAIVGKALRGTGKQLYGGEEPQKQVLHVYEVPAGHCLAAVSDCSRAQCSEYPEALVDRSAL